jgi:hypothetical protein
MHLITVKYSSDAERKRIEYVFEKWADRLTVFKPEGIVAIVDESQNESIVHDLVQELYSRSSKAGSDNISIYEINRTNLAIERAGKKISLDFHEKRETVEKLLDYILAKQRAILKRETDSPPIKTYEISSKKGTVEISTMLREKDDIINILITISGYGEVVDFISDKLNEELKYFEVRAP